MHPVLLIAAMAAAPAPDILSPEQIARARTQMRQTCGILSRDALLRLPEPRRSEAVSCVLKVAAPYLNAGMPERVNRDMTALSIAAEGTILRFTVRAEGELARSFDRNAPAVVSSARDRLCRGSKFEAFTSLGARLGVRFVNSAGKTLMQTEVEPC